MFVRLKVVLVVTILHELMHHLAKLVFGAELTPPGIDSICFGAGEAGLEIEERLFNGVVSVVWNSQDVTEMEKVQGLVLDYRGSLWNLCEYYTAHFMYFANI